MSFTEPQASCCARSTCLWKQGFQVLFQTAGTLHLYKVLFWQFKIWWYLGGGGHLRSFSVLRTQELHDDTNWNSCRRQHLLPASSVCGSVFKFVCARKNFCREFNSTRRACSNPTIPRYRMLGMDRWENITCTNDLLWSSQVNINQALVSRFTSLPLLPPAFNSNPVISVMHDTWKEPFYLKWKFKFFLFLERVSSICSDWDDQKH